MAADIFCELDKVEAEINYYYIIEILKYQLSYIFKIPFPALSRKDECS